MQIYFHSHTYIYKDYEICIILKLCIRDGKCMQFKHNLNLGLDFSATPFPIHFNCVEKNG